MGGSLQEASLAREASSTKAKGARYVNSGPTCSGNSSTAGSSPQKGAATAAATTTQTAAATAAATTQAAAATAAAAAATAAARTTEERNRLSGLPPEGWGRAEPARQQDKKD
ncbi:hypothetical protein Emag_002312 [Eimeria magna]